MAVLHVITRSGERCVSMNEGQSVREALDSTGLRVRAACGGIGSCGACVVRWLEGDANPPTVAEYQKLTEAQRNQGWRLACQLRPRGESKIRLDHPARPSQWHSIPADDLPALHAALPELERHIYGVAVDLGTTHIRATLWDRWHGRRIASRCGPNPQQLHGADVLNRLAAAVVNPQQAKALADLARHAIVQALRDMLARDVGEIQAMLAEIGQVLVVGNTAMLALLSGHGAAALLDPANWQRQVDCQPLDAAAWQAQWRLPHGKVYLADAVSGFVGSDLPACIVATGLTEGPPGSLLLDVGTNTEIALWDGHTMHVSSVPGGPAFEGGGIRHGMAAEEGAIYRVAALPGADGAFACDVIGGGAARGFCGSGLVDAIAVLLDSGLLKPSGRFVQPAGGAGYALLPDNPCTSLSGSDVDAFQRAKAATAAAMECLLGLAGLGWEDIRRLCVCGAFGRRLDIGHAQRAGLLPALDASRIELYADAALAGCERALLNPRGHQLLADAAATIRLVNLACWSDYENVYIEHLRLSPIRVYGNV